MIIWLASYPRSGNTFLRILLQESYRIRSNDVYRMYDSENSVNVAPNLEITVGQASLEQLAASEEKFVLKTHDMPPDDSPALYLVRDGRDAYVSYAHYVMKYGQPQWSRLQRQTHDNMLKKLIVDNPFGGWSANVLAWTQRTAPTAVIRFEDLIADPVGSVREGLAKIDFLPPEDPNARVPDCEELRQKFPAFYRKGQMGSWREEMPPRTQILFWERHGDAMRQMGYPYD